MKKVLVVDDSALMRRLLSNVLTDAGFQVQLARNGTEGLRQLTEWEPDVLTLDINMPEMDGLTALSLMMQTRPTPVVMVSSLTERGAQATFEALALGAVDFIAKPGGTISLSVEDIREELLSKIEGAAKARLDRQRGRRALAAAPRSERRRITATPSPMNALPPRTGALQRREQQRRFVVEHESPSPHHPRLDQPGVVLIGVSTGGPRTLEDILPQLPADFPWPVVVAQHMPPHFTQAFAQRMDQLCALQVREVSTPMPLESGSVYVGQGGHDIVLSTRLGRLVAQPCPEHPDHPWHPSVDVLVQSAMALLPADRLIGVQLTGMGHDGACAMSQLRQKGGRTIAESQETAVVWGMPRELIERNGASVILPSTDIALQLNEWLMRGATAAPQGPPH